MRLAAVVRTAFHFRLPRRTAPSPRKHTLHARARHAVLFGIAALLLAQVGLSVAVETNRPQWRDPEFFHRRKQLADMKKWAVKSGEARTTVVVLGGSRPQVGFRPRYLGFAEGPTDPIVYNCSRTGSRPFDLWMNFNRLCDAGVVPDFLLVEVLPPFLVEQTPIDEQVRLHRLSTTELSRLRHYASNPVPTALKWCGMRLAAWHTFRFDLLAHAGQGDLIPNAVREDFLWKGMQTGGDSPYYPNDWTDERRERATKLARVAYEKMMADFRINPAIDRIYRDLLSSCRERGVRVALFLMPESPLFRSSYPSGGRDTLRAYLSGLSSEFAVPCFDSSEWFGDETPFTDGHHLLGPASEAFSKRFGRECVAPWLHGAG